jgi:uncharacterized integral membrane protein
MVDKAERKILDMIEQGQISANEGLRLINAMKKDDDQSAQNEQVMQAEVAYVPSPDRESDHPHIPEEEMARMKRLKRWWVLPFGIGLVITILGAIWMYMGYTSAGFGFGFWLAWLPFLLGIFITAVSFKTNQSVWIHVRVKQKPGQRPERISISLPLPLNMAKWFFTAFGDRIPGLKEQPIGDISSILENLSPEEPFYVHVNDDDDDEEVEVFIG